MTESGNESSSHFDGFLESDERSPSGFVKIADVEAVCVDPNTGRLVLTGRPGRFHNCDQRGCSSVEHKIAEFSVDKELFEPIRIHTEEP